MKLLLVILFLVLAVPIAFTGASLTVEFSLGRQSVACFGRCVDGRVIAGVGMAWR